MSPVYSFNQDSVIRAVNYKTKRFNFLPASLGAIKVIANAYPVGIDVIYPIISRTLSYNVASETPERIEDVGLVDVCDVRIYGTSEVSAVYLASTMEELPV